MTKSINELKNQFTAKEKLSKEHQVAIKGGDDKRNPPPPISISVGTTTTTVRI